MGYPIEGVEAEGEGGAEAEKPIEFYLAAADSGEGRAGVQEMRRLPQCRQGRRQWLGPNLWGVMGEPVGKRAGFAFSDALWPARAAIGTGRR